MKKERLRIVVLEDNVPIAERFAAVFCQWPAVLSVQTAGTLAAALSLIESSPIDLLVVDINLPDGSGIDAIAELSRHQPQALAIVISALSQRSVVVDAIRAGALGYLLKDDDELEIIDACQELLEGKSPMSASIARLLVEQMQSELTPTPPNPLTERESQLLVMLAKGYSYREAAVALAISVSTVQSHIRNIYRKLQVNNRTEAAQQARELGLISY